MEREEQIILKAADVLRREGSLGQKDLAALIRAANRGIPSNADHLAKKHLMPFYLRVKAEDPERWERWGFDEQLDQKLLRLLQVKPRRTASGVATIAVITKPWPCANECLYCPNDLRMPKSYIADEPACQRAERNWFDPYLQVAARLKALHEMGHVTDKVELIILGSSWTDYPAAYRRWFVAELFRALNEAGASGDAESRAAGPQATTGAGNEIGKTANRLAEQSIEARRTLYQQASVPHGDEECAEYTAAAQQRVNVLGATYRQEFPALYGEGTPWDAVASWQTATWKEVERQHAANEDGAHRVVGLVMETRPDAISTAALADMRRLGATKVQMGIQSLDEGILKANCRATDLCTVRRAFELARLMGFKSHAHLMLNLLSATPNTDRQDFARLIADESLKPDEVKLYPCALVAGTGLVAHFEGGSWQPYTEEQLTDVLAEDLLDAPPYLRVSRMIRDIPAQDILTGNKKINLRQMVESHASRLAAEQNKPIQEIRHREISTEGASHDELRLDEVRYCTAVSDEMFLQWVTPEGRIAGFLRLSLPYAEAVERAADEADRPLPIQPGEAMIREVHIYGNVAGLHQTSSGAQHRGLGRALIERACAIAQGEGYRVINVISAVGTRGYYRNLGFSDNGLYQQRKL